jgi:hypothetical protein
MSFYRDFECSTAEWEAFEAGELAIDAETGFITLQEYEDALACGCLGSRQEDAVDAGVIAVTDAEGPERKQMLGDYGGRYADAEGIIYEICEPYAYGNGRVRIIGMPDGASCTVAIDLS